MEILKASEVRDIVSKNADMTRLRQQYKDKFIQVVNSKWTAATTTSITVPCPIAPFFGEFDILQDILTELEQMYKEAGFNIRYMPHWNTSNWRIYGAFEISC